MPAASNLPVKTMQDLVSSLNSVMGDGGLGDDQRVVCQVKQLMRSYVSQSHDWAQYAVYQEGTRYTRNLVDDGNGKYNLLILVWGESQSSPIHDHAGSHCMMKLLDGQLTEHLFAWPNPTLKLKRSMPLQTNAVAYMHDKIGLHRIANPASDRKAVSLHLYSPPYQMCTTFDEHTGEAEMSSCAAERLKRPDSGSFLLHSAQNCSPSAVSSQSQGSAITSS
ncbi:hypothetical protein LPJ63_000086 [Coemansia sp. RSA 2711]|nr:hypothetical protein LPJ63_000086 [Coemansia sp. RSA 2711]KAJ2318616.1 hypothetical protein IWW52_002457 [Coemansia sp. RSA 2704]KAJ2737803.1 hypothetical protein H4R23_001586 [Coemansia sp. Cherry 401B]